jgi:hypothetical protein
VTSAAVSASRSVSDRSCATFAAWLLREALADASSADAIERFHLGLNAVTKLEVTRNQAKMNWHQSTQGLLRRRSDQRDRR